MNKFLIFLAISLSCFAGELKVITTPAKPYNGNATTSVIKDSSGKTIATTKTTNNPIYAGGGTTTVVKDSSGKTSSIINVTPVKTPSGGQVVKVRKP